MIHYSWPYTICPPLAGLTWGQLYATDVTEPLSGVEHVRQYWPGPKRSSKVEFALDGADASREWVRALCDQIRPQATVVSLRHPLERWLRRHWVGYGDGTRKEFVAPVHAFTGTARLIVQGSAGTVIPTLYQAANLLTDDQAAAVASVTGWNANKASGAGTVTLSRSTQDALYGTHAVQVLTSVDSCVDPGILSDYVAPITSGHYYTAFAWVLVNSTAPENARVVVTWHDAGAVTTGTSTGTTTALSHGWNLVQVTDVAPALTVRCKLRVELVGTAASGSLMAADCIGLAPLRSAEWWLPSLAPGVAVVTSAPAANASVYFSTRSAAYPVLSYRVVGGSDPATDGADNEIWSWDLVETWES